MKSFILATLILLYAPQLRAQQTTSEKKGPLKTMDYGEPDSTDKESKRHLRQLRYKKVYIPLDLTPGGVYAKTLNSTYFVTKLKQPEDGLVRLESVELRLYPYYHDAFDLKLLVLQVNGNDTTYNVIPLSHKDYGMNKMTVKLWDKNIQLAGGDFFIGFGFTPNFMEDPIEYRMFVNDIGTGAIIQFAKGGGITIAEDEKMPYIFPFKIGYRKL